jgi:MFS family permease
MQRVGLLWWAKGYGGTRSAVAIALASTIPMVLLLPYGGVLADRFAAKRLLVTTDLIRLLATGLLAVVVSPRTKGLIFVCVLVIFSSSATSVFEPTYNAVVPRLVREEDLGSANAIGLANLAGANLIGPILAAALLATTSLPLLVAVNSLTFGWSALFVLHTTIPKLAAADATDADTPKRMRLNVRNTVALVRSIPGLSRLVGLPILLNAAVAPLSIFVLALAVDRFHLNATGFGLMQVALGLGLLIGALSAAQLLRGRTFAPLQLVALSLAALPIWSSTFAGVALFTLGFATAIANTELLTAFQLLVPEHSRGRVFGVSSSLTTGLRPASLLLAAPMLSVLGVRGAFVVVAAAVAIPTLVWGRGSLTQDTDS